MIRALVERLPQVQPEPFRRGFQIVEIGQVGLVGPPEIERVGEAGAHHLAIAVGDLLAVVLRLDVGGDELDPPVPFTSTFFDHV